MNHPYSNIGQLTAENAKSKQLYRHSLIHPEGGAGAKIPSPIPQESATACIKYNFNITTNASGNFMIIMDPHSSKIHVNNSDTLDTIGGGKDNWTPYDCSINTDIIDMFRVVSAGINLQYIGQLHTVAGYFIGASTSNISAATNNTFLPYNSIEDISNKVVVSPLEGLKLIYIPSDNSQFEYYKATDYTEAGHESTRWKSCMILAGSGLPPSTTCMRIDVTKNFEYVSKTNMREYIHHTEGQTGTPDSHMFSGMYDYAVRTGKAFLTNPENVAAGINFARNRYSRTPY